MQAGKQACLLNGGPHDVNLALVSFHVSHVHSAKRARGLSLIHSSSLFSTERAINCQGEERKKEPEPVQDAKEESENEIQRLEMVLGTLPK